MTDLQFDIMDELYFVISFGELSSRAVCEENKLIEELAVMIKLGWVRVLREPDQDLDLNQVDFDQLKNYYFLATKNGLFAHNTQ